MPRAAAQDPLQAFRFHARSNTGLAEVLGTNPNDLLQPEASSREHIINNGAEAGFNSITMPELTLELGEYREGIMTYTQKYPGVPSVNDLTFNRGATRKDTAFFNWVLAAVEGNNYRDDITIYHIPRPQNTLNRDTAAGNNLPINDETSKRYICREAVPIRVKPSADLDASTSDVGLMEMDVAFERFDIERPTA